MFFLIIIIFELLIINIMKLYPFNYQSFGYYLSQRESSGNYKAQNLIAYGKYQFTIPTLNRLMGESGIDYIDTNNFLNSPIIQDTYFVLYVRDIIKEIISLNLTKYIGQSIDGQTINIYGLVGGAWLGGVGGLQNYLNNHLQTPDYLGTNISDYIKLFSSYKISNI